MRTVSRLIVLWIALAVTLACSLGAAAAPGAQPSEAQRQATLDAVQATIDAMQIASESTAQVWMTQAAPANQNNEGGAGTATPYGAISGTISFPSEQIPALRLVAFHAAGSAFVALEVPAGTSEYRMDNVPPGSYTLVAYPLESRGDSIAGGYTQAVPCGLLAACSDHSLISFDVRAGETSAGINPADWYAPAGDFPPDPTR